MMTIGILTIIVLGTFVSVGAKCTYSKDQKGYVMVNCYKHDLTAVPDDVLNDVETFDLRGNYIGKLTNDSFSIYPNIKKLLMSFNQVHTIEPGALRSLSELELLDLTQNAVKVVPNGLPKSLTRLLLNKNPVTDMRSLATAVGLRVLHLQGCDLTEYPSLGIMPNLVELDVSENKEIRDLAPVQLAATCRLVRLNVTGAAELFRPGNPGAHCRCRRVVQWAHTYKVTVYGLDQCPNPVNGDGEVDRRDDPQSEACDRTPDDALAVFKECMAEWEHRNMPYWAIASGLVIAVAVLVSLCVCLRRRRRRRRRGTDGKAQGTQSPPPPSDSKIANNDSAGHNNKTEPALLSSAA